MTGPTLAFLLLVLASTGILAVLIVGLVKNELRLVRSVSAVGDEVSPIVDDITAEADRASDHVARLAAAWASIRSRD